MCLFNYFKFLLNELRLRYSCQDVKNKEFMLCSANNWKNMSYKHRRRKVIFNTLTS